MTARRPRRKNAASGEICRGHKFVFSGLLDLILPPLPTFSLSGPAYRGPSLLRDTLSVGIGPFCLISHSTRLLVSDSRIGPKNAVL